MEYFSFLLGILGQISSQNIFFFTYLYIFLKFAILNDKIVNKKYNKAANGITVFD